MSVDHSETAEAPPSEKESAANSAKRRGWVGRRSRTTGSPDVPAAPAEKKAALPVAAEPRGAQLRTSARAAARGRYAPLAAGAPTTTRQGEILNPALIAAPLNERGIVIGRDRTSSAAVAHDSFTAYEEKLITSPHVVVLGDIGSGKSSLLKTVYWLRPCIVKKRRGVVLDRKDRDGEGEYCELSRRFGGSVFGFRAGGGGTRLNPLDPRILDVVGAGGAFRLVKAMAERASGTDLTLDSWAQDALRKAVKRALRDAARDDRVPVLGDIESRLGVVDGDDAWSDYSVAAKERVHQAGLEVRQLLIGAVSDDLAGLFDGPTSNDVQLNSKLTVFDISQLPADGPATALVLVVAQAWLLGTLRKDRGHGTNFLLEEGWDLVTGPISRQINANQMVARGLGLCNVAAMHNIAQMPNSSAARSLLKEPETIHIYRQDRREDAVACGELYGLDPGSVEALSSLDQGTHLLKVGSRPEIVVEHVRSALEAELTRTDSGMLVGGAS